MGVFNENAIIGASAAGGGGGFDIPYSCRFNDDTSAKLTRATWTSSAANRRKWTYSVWFKLSSFDDARDFFFCGAHDECMMSNSPANTIDWFTENTTGRYITNQVFRDPNAWYHAVFRMDTTDGTPADRMQLFINGTRIPDANFGTSNDPTLNHQTYLGDGSSAFVIGGGGVANYWDGYMAEIHFIDGSALNADQFGEFGDYDEWKPIAYSGSHGTNGFYLDFSNASALGADAAGSNNFTVSGVAAHDQMKDSPSNNFCTMNSINNYPNSCTFAEGNLKVTDGGDGSGCWSNFGMNSGKWYCEVHILSDASDPSSMIGISGSQPQLTLATELGSYPDEYIMGGGVTGVNANGKVRTNDVSSTYSSSPALSTAAGETIGMAVDLDNNKMYWRTNGGAWVNGADPVAGSGGWGTGGTSGYLITPKSGHYHFAVGRWNPGTNVFVMNFGQDGTFAGNKTAGDNADDEGYGNFLYDVPTGFKALCTKNLPDPTVVPSEHFNTVLYTGTGSARSITGVGFQPDLHWLKIRTGEAKSHMITDSVRGAGKYLSSDGDAAEANDIGTVSSFDADGWSFGNAAPNQFNYNTRTYVAWNWKAGTAGSGATQGSGTLKTYTSSYNTAAGFSITKYTGNGTANHKIPHSLSVAPNLVITKQLNSAGWTRGWAVGTVQPLVPMTFSDYFVLNTTAPKAASASGVWNNIAPTATVFNCGDAGSFNYTNQNAQDYIAYCWHDVEGYSKIGVYNGNGNNDGTFIYTGFTPAYVIIKHVTTSGKDWVVFDSARSPIVGISTRSLRINLTDQEDGGPEFDWCSNGFKMRTTSSPMNTNDNLYFYIAFAEKPFKHTNGR